MDFCQRKHLLLKEIDVMSTLEKLAMEGGMTVHRGTGTGDCIVQSLGGRVRTISFLEKKRKMISRKKREINLSF